MHQFDKITIFVINYVAYEYLIELIDILLATKLVHHRALSSQNMHTLDWPDMLWFHT